MGRTVYLVQTPSIPKHNGRIIDISPLLWHGNVRLLMEDRQNASYNPAAARNQIRERLKDFDPEKDFIAFAGGDSLAFFMVGSVLTELGHDHMFYLRFERTRLPDGSRDPASGEYIPVLVPLTHDTVQEILE